MTFFIWTHSEADLLKFIQDFNNVHPTITFSQNQDVNFLDVTLEKKTLKMNLKPEVLKNHPTAISMWNTHLATQDHVNL